MTKKGPCPVNLPSYTHTHTHTHTHTPRNLLNCSEDRYLTECTQFLLCIQAPAIALSILNPQVCRPLHCYLHINTSSPKNDCYYSYINDLYQGSTFSKGLCILSLICICRKKIVAVSLCFVFLAS